MAFQCLFGKNKLKGLEVKLVEFDDDVVYVGKMEFYNADSGKLGLVSRDSTQLQLFYERDVHHCEILRDHEVPTDDAASHVKSGGMMSEDQMKQVFKEVKPKSSKNYSFFFKSKDNKHLRRLHPLQMKKLLCGGSSPDEPELLTPYQDHQGHQYYQLPGVVQTSDPRMNNVNNQEVHGGFTEKVIREKLWIQVGDKKTFPNIVTPSRLYVIDHLDELYSHAISVIVDCDKIGLSCEGKTLGRHGSLCWLAVCTDDAVFLFDIVCLGQEAFKYGLRTVLQDKKIIKIVHDVRFIHDCLFGQFDIKLTNVFDTMIGDIVFLNQYAFGGFLPAFNRSLSTVLRDYLGIEDFHIFYPRYRRTHLAEDSAVWVERPSSISLLLGAARNCLYLPALYRIVRKGTLLPFHHSCHVLKNFIKTRDAPDAARAQLEMDELPRDVYENLPDWIQDTKAKVGKFYPIFGNFIAQNVSNPDPLCIFSKDSMHQSAYIAN